MSILGLLLTGGRARCSRKKIEASEGVRPYVSI